MDRSIETVDAGRNDKGTIQKAKTLVHGYGSMAG
jgi:hypothetical protein